MHNRYAITIALTIAIVSASIVSFCFIVNPFRLFPSVPLFNPEKPADPFYYLRLHKPYAIERIQPSVLIVGSSRSAALPVEPLNELHIGEAYNASLPGISLREIRRIVEHAQAVNPLKFVLIGLDYPMFLQGYSGHMSPDDDHRYLRLSPSLGRKLHRAYQVVEDYWRALFSVDAILASWRVLSGSGGSQRAYYDDGTWEINTSRPIAPGWFYASLTRQMYEYANSNTLDMSAFDELTALLDFADNNEIEVVLFISPMQGLLMQAVFFADGWDQYLSWHRQLVDLITNRSNTTEIYGLEDNPQLVLEAVDAPRPFFKDGIHFNHGVGKQFVRCLTNTCNSDLQTALLNKHTVDAYLAKVEVLRRRYVQENPADVVKARHWLRLNPGVGD